MNQNVRLPAHIKPERYQIMLKPDLNEFIFTGEETIFLSVDKSTRTITLHSIDLEIEGVEFIHGNRASRAGKIFYDQKAETATFRFPKEIQKGKGKLKIIFKGILNDKMRGFYRSRYEVNGVSRHLATTQFESTDARRAFPCFDEPAQKAIFDVTLMVPPGTTAISNTIESEIREHESGYKVVEFAPTPKMSTYLLAFIVGEFEYIEGKTKAGHLVRVFTTPGKKDQARFALDVAIKCLDFYENYFGIPYPLPVMDLIAIPDFAAGAMENWGAVTYRESTLLIDEAASSTANKQWVALVIAHELAHQWFGNLVTMEWWTHLWLNEGFASFIEYVAIDRIFPQWDIWTQFVSTEMGSAFELDSLENTHPIEVSVGHPAEISEIFDKVSYSKGASVLRMLWQYLGERDFQKGLKHYLSRHAYSNASTVDLWQALEEISHKPVIKVMKNWTSKAGHPVIRVIDQGKKLKLEQSRFFSSAVSKRMSEDKTVWNIPLHSIKASGKKEAVLMDQKSIVMDKPVDWIKFNAGETSLVKIDYPHYMLRDLEPAIVEKKLSAVDRLGLIRDSFDLAQAGNSPTTLALDLAKNYIEEEDYTVWSQLTGQILKVDSLIALEPFYGDFKNYGRGIYKGIAANMGWGKKAGEKHTDSLLRGMALSMLGRFGDAETIKMAQGMFGKEIEPDLRGTVYNLAAENGGKEEFDQLLRMYRQEDNQQEKERIGRAMGRFKLKRLLERTLEFSISKHVRYQNTLGIIASVWNNPTGRYLAWEFVKRKWDLLKERYAGSHYFTRVFTPAGDFTKVGDARDIEKFTSKNPIPEAKRSIAQALEQIYSNAEWLKRDKDKIKKLLSGH